MKTATLALDLGTSTGWALLRPDGKIDHGVTSFALAGNEGCGARFLKFRSWLHSIKYMLEQGDISIERIYYERNRGARWRNAAAAEVCLGMRATLEAWAEHHQIPYFPVSVGELKGAMTGVRSAKKPEIIKAVRARGYAVTDDNEADALGLLLMRMQSPAAAA